MRRTLFILLSAMLAVPLGTSLGACSDPVRWEPVEIGPVRPSATNDLDTCERHQQGDTLRIVCSIDLHPSEASSE